MAGLYSVVRAGKFLGKDTSQLWLKVQTVIYTKDICSVRVVTLMCGLDALFNVNDNYFFEVEDIKTRLRYFTQIKEVSTYSYEYLHSRCKDVKLESMFDEKPSTWRDHPYFFWTSPY